MPLDDSQQHELQVIGLRLGQSSDVLGERVEDLLVELREGIINPDIYYSRLTAMENEVEKIKKESKSLVNIVGKAPAVSNDIGALLVIGFFALLGAAVLGSD